MKHRRSVLALASILVALCSATSPSLASAAISVGNGGWILQEPKLPTMAAVCFVDQNSGWMVGAYGTILHSTNGGQTWAQQRSNTVSDLAAVAFGTSSCGWAAGAGGSVVHTTNGGSSWIPAATGTSADALAIAAKGETTAWIVRSGNALVHTSDGGTTWDTQAIATAASLKAIACADASDAWIVGTSGLIAHTTDGGQSWAIENSGTTEDLCGVSFSDAQSGRVLSTQGTVLVTSDGGATWSVTRQTSSTSVDLSAAYFASTLQGWAVGYDPVLQSGRVLHTADGGHTWAMQYDAASQYSKLVALDFVPGALQAWAVGDGIIVHTGDGTSWAEQDSGVAADLRSVSAVSPAVAWAAGGNQILRTIDGGLTWSPTSLPAGLSENLTAVSAVSADSAWLVGDQGSVFHSSDGGLSWNPETVPTVSPDHVTPVPLSAVHFTDALHGFVGGEYDCIYATTDGGQNWATAYDDLQAGSIVNFAFADASNGWAGDLHTTDGGQSWSAPSAVPQMEINGVTALDSHTAWLVGDEMPWVGSDQMTFDETTDGGATWDARLVDGPTAFSWLAFADGSHGWAGTTQNRVFATTDGGTAWLAEPSAPDIGNDAVASESFPTASFGWAVSNTGRWSDTTDGGASWQSTYVPEQPFAINGFSGLKFTSAKLGWAAGGNQLFKTTDGGWTWTTVGYPGSGQSSFDSIAFRGRNGYIASAAYGFGLRTTNAGRTWQLAAPPGVNGSDAVAFADANHLWAVGMGCIERSTNAGRSWSRQTPLSQTVWYTDVAPTSVRSAWVSAIRGSGGELLHTTNGGATWRVRQKTSHELWGVCLADSKHGWAVGAAGTILHMSDGVHWKAQHSGTRQDLRSVVFINDSQGWAVGQRGTILYTHDDGRHWLSEGVGQSTDLGVVTAVRGLPEAWAAGSPWDLFRVQLSR